MLRVPPGAGAAVVDRGMHRRQYLWVLAHAEIVVGAPYRDLGADAMVIGARKPPGSALEIGKDAIAPLTLQLTELPLEKRLVVHDPPRCVCVGRPPA
jgi:hypothetical protein